MFGGDTKMSKKTDWYAIYLKRTVEDILIFDDKRTPKEIVREYNIKLKEVKELFSNSPNVKTEKYTYELLTGQRPDTTEFSKPYFIKNYTLQRLSALAEKYDEVKQMVRNYAKGRITLDYLSKFIAAFRETNIDYLLAYGGTF